MIVIATDAPLLSRNLQRLARRAVLGLARTGSFMSNGSGDFVIAFSTHNRVSERTSERERVRRLEELDNNFVTPLMLAVVESVEEAVYNSLTRATTGTSGWTMYSQATSTPPAGRSVSSGAGSAVGGAVVAVGSAVGAGVGSGVAPPQADRSRAPTSDKVSSAAIRCLIGIQPP